MFFLEQKSFQCVQVVLAWGLYLELGRGWYRLSQASCFLPVSDLPSTASGLRKGVLLLLQLPIPNCKGDALKMNWKVRLSGQNAGRLSETLAASWACGSLVLFVPVGWSQKPETRGAIKLNKLGAACFHTRVGPLLVDRWWGVVDGHGRGSQADRKWLMSYSTPKSPGLLKGVTVPSCHVKGKDYLPGAFWVLFLH